MSSRVAASERLRVALGRKGDADLGEEALHRCRGRRAAEVLASHHLEVGKLLLVLEPPRHRVVLALILDLWQREVLL